MSEATFSADQTKLVIGTAKGVAKANAKAEAVAEERVSAYTGTLTVATQMGADDFDSAMGNLFDAIRVNMKGLAKRAGAKPAKTDGRWTVPGALSSARSVIKDAYAFGIPMLEPEAEEPTVRKFTVIREDVKAAKKALADAERTEHDVLRDELVDQLRKIAEGTATEEPDAVMATSYQVLVDALDNWVLAHAELAGEETAEVVLAEAA